MDVYVSHTFLIKVEIFLQHKWAHLKICQISIGKRYVDGNFTGLSAGAVEPAWQLRDVGVELFYTLHKLTHADALGFLEHVHDVITLLLGRVFGKHCEKVEHAVGPQSNLEIQHNERGVCCT
jgi:hypothetical protein